MFQDPRSSPTALDGQEHAEDTDRLGARSCSETGLWSEIGGHSVREAPGSRMSQSGRTEGLDFPAWQMQDITFPARHIQPHEPGMCTPYILIHEHIHILIFLQTRTYRFLHLLAHAYSMPKAWPDRSFLFLALGEGEVGSWAGSRAGWLQLTTEG